MTAEVEQVPIAGDDESGKFVNGAATAAFGWLFNDAAHNCFTHCDANGAEPGIRNADGVFGLLVPALRAGSLVLDALSGGFAAEGAEGVTSLYRAVGPAELEDIQATGAFQNLGSAEGKHFTTSGEAASSYARQAVNAFGDEPYTIVQTNVPNSVLNGMSPVNVDGGIPAYVVPNGSLPGLRPNVMNYSPIPGVP